MYKDILVTKDNGTTHRLINSDFLLVKDLPVFDAVITDLPFGVTAQVWDKVIPSESMWHKLNSITKETTPIMLFSSAKFSPYIQMSNIEAFKYRWVWKKNIKTNFTNAKRMPLRCLEDINVFYSNQPTYNPQMTTGHKPTNSALKSKNGACYRGEGVEYKGGVTTRYPSEVLEFDSVSNKHRSHSNEKPLDLLRYLIRTYTNVGDTVLDFTAGSFSLAVACYLEGRNSVCIEMDTEQYEKSIKWVESCSVDNPYNKDVAEPLKGDNVE